MPPKPQRHLRRLLLPLDSEFSSPAPSTPSWPPPPHLSDAMLCIALASGHRPPLTPSDPRIHSHGLSVPSGASAPLRVPLFRTLLRNSAARPPSPLCPGHADLVPNRGLPFGLSLYRPGTARRRLHSRSPSTGCHSSSSTWSRSSYRGSLPPRSHTPPRRPSLPARFWRPRSRTPPASRRSKPLPRVAPRSPPGWMPTLRLTMPPVPRHPALPTTLKSTPRRLPSKHPPWLLST